MEALGIFDEKIREEDEQEWNEVESQPSPEPVMNLVFSTPPLRVSPALSPLWNFSELFQEIEDVTAPVSTDVKAKAKRIISLLDIEPFFQKKSLAGAAKELGVGKSTIKRICRENHIPRWPSSRSTRRNSSANKRKRDPESASTRKSSQEDPGTPTCPTGCEQVMEMDKLPPKTTMEIVKETTVTNQIHSYLLEGLDESSRPGTRQEDDEGSSTFVVKATYKEDTIRFNFSNTFGFVELKEELGKGLELEPNKFKIKYQDEDNDWILMTHDSDLRLCLHLSRSFGKNVVRLSISAGGMTPRFAARQDVNSVTIKATFREDIIRFSLSLSSNVVELKEEVAKRLKLEVGTFEIKYLDEDYEWLFIACDADLQECLDISKSSGSNMVRLLIHDSLGNLGSSCESSGE